MERYSIEDLLTLQTGLSAEEIEALAQFAGIGLFNLHIPTGDIRLNKNVTQLTGYEPGDLPHTDNTREMLTFEEDRPRVNRNLSDVITGKTDRVQQEYRMKRRDGSVVSILESIIALSRDENGVAERLGGVTFDLSELKMAEEKARDMEAETRRMAEGLDEGALVEQNRMLRAANTAATVIIGGYHQDYEAVLRQSLQVLGESVQADRAYIWRNMLVDGEFCCAPRAEWAKDGRSTALASDKPACYRDFLPDCDEYMKKPQPIRMLVKDLPPVMTKALGLRDVKSLLIAPLILQGSFWGFLGFDDCVRERVFTADEAEIMMSGALVVASSVARNETFAKLNATRDEAISSTRAKSEFLSRMSHEIRTPMNAIIGMTAIAQKSDDIDRIRYCLEKVDASSRQLLGIINDVLDMSKIDAGKLEIFRGPFDFERMVQNVINVVQVKLDEKHQQLRVNFQSLFTRMMLGDELRISQVLINLLNNATKFTPDKCEIFLTIHEEPVDADSARLRISVRDTGIGIAREQQQRLFNSFEQADGSITRQYGGTGLGLAICKKIVSLMGGDIWVESEPDSGADFVFDIEIGWGDAIARQKPRPLNENLRILIVDDVRDVREYFRTILSGFSLSCDLAASGEEALAAVQESISSGRPYDLVFLDWNMPGMNGGETAYEMRKLIGDVVAVMISSTDWADIEQEAKTYGVDNFLAKPVLPSMLYNSIVTLTQHIFESQLASTEEHSRDWRGKTVLLAEDIDINREIVASMLHETGVTIDFACDGEEALRCFSADPARYDMVLMDVQMPLMDGLEATRQIRALSVPEAKCVPIVAMTANAFKEDVQLCIQAGMNDHLAKPLDPDILFQTLSGYLEGGK